MLLTKEERERFIQYLQQEKDSTHKLIEQAEKIGLPKPMLDRLRLEYHATNIVCHKLQNVEEQIFGG
jgi:gamma-glutamyl phosphate reductase